MVLVVGEGLHHLVALLQRDTMRQANVFNAQVCLDVTQMRVASHTCIATQVEVLHDIDYFEFSSRLGDLQRRQGDGSRRQVDSCLQKTCFFRKEKLPAEKMSDDDTISVSEFLEAELYHEMAQHLECDMNGLRKLKHDQPETVKRAAHYVLNHVVTPECRMFVLEKRKRLKLEHERGSHTAATESSVV